MLFLISTVSATSMYPTWYDTDYDLRRNIDFGGTTLEIQDGFEFSFELDYINGMGNNFETILITWYNASSLSEETVPFFVTNINSSVISTVWIKLPHNFVPIVTDFYIYYNNNTAVTSTSNSTLVFSENLVSFWEMEERTAAFAGMPCNDSVGNNDGLNGLVGRSLDYYDDLWNAYSYGDSLVKYTTLPDDLISGWSDLTLSFWIKQDTSNDDQVIFASELDPLALSIIITATSEININQGGSGLDSPVLTITDGTWYYLTLVKEGTTWYIYRNGVLFDTLTDASYTDIDTTSGLTYYFGGSLLGGTIIKNYNGILDDFRLYNTALSSTDVEQLYSSATSFSISIGSVQNISDVLSLTVSLNTDNNTRIENASTFFNFIVQSSIDDLTCNLQVNDTDYGIIGSNYVYTENGTSYDTDTPYTYFVNYTNDGTWNYESIWSVMHGGIDTSNATSNYTLENCELSPEAQFKVYVKFSNYTSYCWTGLNWYLLEEIYDTNYTISGNPIESSEVLYDGDWTTGAYYLVGDNEWHLVTSSYGPGILFEEALYKNVKVKNDTITSIYMNNTIIDGTYDWDINCTINNISNISETRQIIIDNDSPYYFSDCQSLSNANSTYYLIDNILNHNGINCISFIADNISLDCQNNTIDALSFYNNAFYSGHSAIIGNNVNNIFINNCTITNFNHAFSYDTVTGGNISNTIIKDNYLGMYLHDSYKLFIYDNYLYNLTQEGIRLDAVGTLYSNNWLTMYNNFFNTSWNIRRTADSHVRFNTTKQIGDRIYSSGTEIGGNYWTTPTQDGYSDTCSGNGFFCNSPLALFTNLFNLKSSSYDYLVLTNNNDTVSPYFSDNSTNTTLVGREILHSLKITDDLLLSGYIFSFDNGTGTFINDTFIEFTGISNWTNISKNVNNTLGSQIRWQVYSNDSYNNWNNSVIYSYNTTNTLPTSNPVTITPTPASEFNNLTCNYIYNDTDGDIETNVWYEWYINDVKNVTTQNLSNINIVVNDDVFCSVIVADPYENSTIVNSSILTIGDTTAPILHNQTLSSISREINNEITIGINVTELNSLDFVYVEITDPNLVSVNFTMSLNYSNNSEKKYIKLYTPITVGIYTFNFYAKDGSGNIAEMYNGTLNFTGLSTTPIVIVTGGGNGGDLGVSCDYNFYCDFGETILNCPTDCIFPLYLKPSEINVTFDFKFLSLSQLTTLTLHNNVSRDIENVSIYFLPTEDDNESYLDALIDLKFARFSNISSTILSKSPTNPGFIYVNFISVLQENKTNGSYYIGINAQGIEEKYLVTLQSSEKFSSESGVIIFLFILFFGGIIYVLFR